MENVSKMNYKPFYKLKEVDKFPLKSTFNQVFFLFFFSLNDLIYLSGFTINKIKSQINHYYYTLIFPSLYEYTNICHLFLFSFSFDLVICFCAAFVLLGKFHVFLLLIKLCIVFIFN